MKIIDGWNFLASLKMSRMAFLFSQYLETILGPLIVKTCASVIEFATSQKHGLPVPGGPCNKIPWW